MHESFTVDPKRINLQKRTAVRWMCQGTRDIGSLSRFCFINFKKAGLENIFRYTEDLEAIEVPCSIATED